jgi:1,3-propanediol dehydrogenase/alcohol dehydrogenase
MGSNVFRFPVQIIFGEGCLQELGTFLPNFGKHALLVTGSTVTKGLAAVEEVKDALKKEEISCTHFAEVESDPSIETVEAGGRLAREAGCDFVIGLGGGSPMDAAKAIAAWLTNPGPISDWEGVGNVRNRSRPIICIPTTSGTGSEATSVAVITDRGKKKKMSILSQNIYPTLSVVDPQLTVSMPPSLTASTGMDALTHAVESYVSRRAWAPTQGLSFKAVQLITAYLERACIDGEDLEARRNLSLASMIAGMAFTNAGLGLTHAMAHVLGSHFQVQHGVANALLLPWVMKFNLEARPDLFRELAIAMGEEVSGIPAKVAGERCIEAVRELVHRLPLPKSLEEVGIHSHSLEMLAAEAFLNTRLRSSNPRETILDDIVGIFQCAL